MNGLTSETVRAHEAGHAAGFIVLCGVLPERVVANGAVGGTTQIPTPERVPPEQAREWVKAILLGPICADQELPSWPIKPTPNADPASLSDDERLASIVEQLELSESDYRGLVVEAYRVAADLDFRRIESTIDIALEYRSTISRAELVDFLDIDQLRKYILKETS